ncbi:sulfite exporter TauE/SafE family protein [Shewanella sp. WXL01]|uniref:sulfite exporter TauE/SafE family protein n=1 Tax=Shewanella sp. WXL01 TaxID=2709721 RepID=UPI0014385943|nr:sulfite exporter TauE/SafE family protein [Shewanella sp. WXL01]NKF50163.1 sulfite exporter TauE/SafE family protein [Shewanella sp. WXL01]
MSQLAHTIKRHRWWLIALITVSTVLWSYWASHYPPITQTFIEYGLFSVLGVVGAIFANSTGAGGGVIFVPVFSALNFTTEQMIATSFAIQCFGMTAGSLTWIFHYLNHHRHDPTWGAFLRFTVLASLCSIAGLWTSFSMSLAAPLSIHTSFSLFSILLGIIIIAHSRKASRNKQIAATYQISNWDFIALTCIGFVGGIITSWLSVGVGEILVIYLMLRGFCAKLAIATGVVVSVLTVWTTAPINFGADSDVHFQALLFAGPGAVIGGMIAKRIALLFSVARLKLFFSAWIILTGIVMLALTL